MIDDSATAHFTHGAFESGAGAAPESTDEGRGSEPGAEDETRPYDGKEYDVVRLRVEPLTLAYLCAVGTFAWPPFYFRFIRGDWRYALAGVFVITLIGSFTAWWARRPPRERSFASFSNIS